jgi:hypothetical protein
VNAAHFNRVSTVEIVCIHASPPLIPTCCLPAAALPDAHQPAADGMICPSTAARRLFHRLEQFPKTKWIKDKTVHKRKQ